ncbi:MAG: helix-turn-helix domain-containing protein [Elusimicrobiota bacterium]
MDKIKTTEELIKRTSKDSKFAGKAIKAVREKSLANLLFALRCKKDITQKELAKKMNCSQAKISKLESSKNKDIKFGDLIAFTQALNLDLSINFSDGNLNLANKVKLHAMQMMKALDEMYKLAGKDEELKKGIEKFHSEAFLNITNMLIQIFSRSSIYKGKKTKKTVPEFSFNSLLDEKNFSLTNARK